MFEIPGSDIGSVHVHEGCVVRAEPPRLARRTPARSPAPRDPADPEPAREIRLTNCEYLYFNIEETYWNNYNEPR